MVTCYEYLSQCFVLLMLLISVPSPNPWLKCPTRSALPDPSCCTLRKDEELFNSDRKYLIIEESLQNFLHPLAPEVNAANKRVQHQPLPEEGVAKGGGGGGCSVAATRARTGCTAARFARRCTHVTATGKQRFPTIPTTTSTTLTAHSTHITPASASALAQPISVGCKEPREPNTP